MKRIFDHPLRCFIVILFISVLLPAAICAQDGWTPTTGIKFNGSNQYIQVNELNGLNDREFSLEAWIQLNDNDGSQIFMNQGAASEEFTFYLFDGKIRILTQDQSGYSHANADPPPAGKWFHCVGVYKNDGSKQLFYNGELKATTRGAHRLLQNDSPLTIGALLNGFITERFLDGRMENIRIWNRALPQEEIDALAKADPSNDNLTVLRESGMIAYWSSRTLHGDTIQDLSSYNNHGKWIESKPAELIVKTVPAHGYEGIWYSNQPSDDKYRYKYSGGLGTYCAKHRHHAQYAPEVNKTFFVYGGTKGYRETNAVLMMVSYYDHASNQLARPAILQEKGTSDAHHNPVLEIDPQGHLWVFASAHGGKDGFIWRSTSPYSIDEFELIEQREFTYPQPRYVPDFGFLFLFTKYTGGREMYVNTSPDGLQWGDDKKISGFGGHYQTSEQHGNVRGTAFNYHPPVGGLNARTNIYYMQTNDFGDTWTNIQGDVLPTPLERPDNPALVHDYQADGKLCYLKDLIYDPDGNPVILYTLSDGFESGPENGERILTTAHWLGNEWRCNSVAAADHNYDMGSLWIEEDGTWKLIAPTEAGPQAYCTGGEVAMWQSKDTGNTWSKTRDLTQKSARNHTYIRRVLNAHPDFFAIWADGDALKPSISRLYFCNQNGDRVWMMPPEMGEDLKEPILVTSSNAEMH